MARKERAAQRLELIYRLDGELREIDVFRLAPALMAAGQVIQESHVALGAAHEVGVNVKPFDRGSFVVDIVLFVKSNWPLMTSSAILLNEAMQKTAHILEAIGMVRSKAESLISVIRKLRGKVDKVEQIKPGDYRVSSGDTAITVNGDVHTLMKDPIIHAGIVQLFTAPMGQEGVTAIETYLKNDRLGTEVKVDKNEAQAFAAFGGTVVPEIDPTREIDTPAVHYLLHPKRLSAEGEPNGWSFRWGKDILSIDKILDKDFLDRVKSGEYRLSSNDLIDAEVVVKQKVSGTKILHESKEIVRIADYKPAPPNPQKDLFLPEV